MVGDSSSLDFITVGNQSTGSFCLQSTPIYHIYQRTIMEQQQRKKQHYSHPWQYPGWSDENATSQMIIIYMTVHRHNAKLTLNTLNCFKDHKRYDIFAFWIMSWIWLDPSEWNQLWKSNTCLSITVNTMPADALATLGARASVGMVLTPRFGLFHLQDQKINSPGQDDIDMKSVTAHTHL